VNAGFSVRFLKLQLSFDDIQVSDDGGFVFQGQTYQWLDFESRTKGPVTLKLVDENFLPKKESAAWKKKIPSASSGDQKVLHVVQKG
jgi:hypothetical protein